MLRECTMYVYDADIKRGCLSRSLSQFVHSRFAAFSEQFNSALAIAARLSSGL